MNAQPIAFPRASSLRARAALRGIDWSETTLAPPERWPPAWTLAVEVCLTAPQAMLVALGADLELLCNDRFARDVNGGKLLCFGSHSRLSADGLALAPLRQAIRHVAKMGEPMLVLNVLRSSAEKWGPLHSRQLGLSLAPLRDQAGQPIGVSAFVVDTLHSPRALSRLAHLHELVTLPHHHPLHHVSRGALSIVERAPDEFRFGIQYIASLHRRAVVREEVVGLPAHIVAELPLELPFERPNRLQLQSLCESIRSTCMRHGERPCHVAAYTFPALRGVFRGVLVMGASAAQLPDREHLEFGAMLALHHGANMLQSRPLQGDGSPQNSS